VYKSWMERFRHTMDAFSTPPATPRTASNEPPAAPVHTRHVALPVNPNPNPNWGVGNYFVQHFAALPPPPPTGNFVM
jgi:hypothetical protein